MKKTNDEYQKSKKSAGEMIGKLTEEMKGMNDKNMELSKKLETESEEKKEILHKYLLAKKENDCLLQQNNFLKEERDFLQKKQKCAKKRNSR